ncbi:MAG: heme/hemin ABC transporter substrate-binding protein [Betaproteobacteria bacterium]
MKRLAAIVLLATAAGTALAQERVIAVGGAVTEIVYALGAGSRLVAVDSTSLEPEAARALPKVGYLRSLSAEGVLSLRPQLLLATADAGPGTALAQIRGAGVPVKLLAQGHSFGVLRDNVREVAAALGARQPGAELHARLEAEWARTTEFLKALPGRPRVAFILAHTGTNMMVAGEDTAAHAMLQLAGATNAASGFKGYKPLTAEAAVAAAPEVILITDQGLQELGGAKRLWEKPGLALTPAAKAGRVVSMDALYLLGFGPRLPQALRDLARQLRAVAP